MLAKTINKKPYFHKIKINFRFLSLFLFALISNPLNAQNTDEQLAAQYYQNGEFDKAVVYYEKLYNKNPTNIYYTYYLQSLLNTKDYKRAEKVVKRLVKQNPEQLNYIVDLGNIYKASDEEGKAKDEYSRAIKSLNADPEQAFALAKSFVAIKEWDYAIDTYKKARKIIPGDYGFYFEMAEVYSAKGDKQAMVNEYLDALEQNESYIQNVQNALQTSFGFDADSQKNEVLKTELVKRIQRSPDKTIFSELLIWMLVQEKDFETAFLQAKAIDKRKKEDGTRLLELAQLSATNSNYDVAVKSYQYVIQKGKENYNYINAKTQLLDVMYLKVTDKKDYTSQELIDLETLFNQTLQELGKNPATVPLMKKLAHLQGFYLNKTTEPISLLREAIGMGGVTPQLKAQCKLELGDILLMSGDVWEASLTYSQVEKAFKHDVLEQEAKFRNAKISYYEGDFKWSKAQLDVLKAATSKLIANDAMELSLLITDNTAIDTNAAPLLMFAKADLLIFQNKNDIALSKLDSINILFPKHALEDDILLKKADVLIKKQRFPEAAGFLESITNTFNKGVLADKALFMLASLNEEKLNDKTKAMKLYEELMLNFPGSVYTVEARKRFRNLRGDIIN